MSKRKILAIILSFATLVLAFLSWFSVQRAILVPDSSKWIIPIVLFSLYMIALCLLGVVAAETLAVELVALASLLSSMFFAFSWIHLGVFFICSFLLLSGIFRVRRDLDLNIKISLWKSLHLGKMRMVLALALIISSQYYFTVKNMPGQINIPKFDLSGVSLKIIKPILGVVNPNFKAISEEGLTVDQYILKSQADIAGGSVDGFDFSADSSAIDSQIPQNLPEAQREALKQKVLQQLSQAQKQFSQKNSELVLQEGRRQLSKIVGQELDGDEKMSDVIVSPINKSINNYFQANFSGNSKSPIFPIILAAVLFLTVWSLGSVLSALWFTVIILIFKLFVRSGAVKIEKIVVEREMIA